MHFTNSVIAAVAALLPLTQAHMLMVDPKPHKDTQNGPLDPSGSNYPCQVPMDLTGTPKVYTPGVAGSWELTGSAVHGGGSCQISITYDENPTKDSVWKVVQSYEGGCPVVKDGPEGNFAADPRAKRDPFSVTFPEGLKAGKATFAWTWFNQIGNREMYMNCAPISIGGSGTSDDVFNGLPDMFIANLPGLGSKNQCTTKEGQDITFPNPGANVVRKDTGKLAPACGGGAVGPAPTNAPPSVTTRPVLIQDPVISTTSVGNSFSEVAPPSTTLAVSTTPRATTVATTTTRAAAPTTTAAAPIPTAPGNNNGTGNDFVGAGCDPNKAIIICHSDPTVYSQCYDNNVEYGPFAVPPGTVCDSTGKGGFKAIQAVSSRFVRRNLARKHRRSYGHVHHRS